MKTVLIISYSPLHSDPRVLRQIQVLKNNYNIHTIGYTSANIKEINYYDINQIIKRTFLQKIKRRLNFEYWRSRYFINYSERLEKILNKNYILSHEIQTPDIIIANDWNGLYLASQLKKKNNWNTKIYFDAHEYAPREYDNSIKWRIFHQPMIIWALKQCKDDISVMSTVCEGIAREYEKFFNFPNGSVKIITNSPEYNSNLKPTTIGGEIIKIIHHGGASKSRKLELMISMMKYLNPQKYELTFMLVKNDQKYYNYLINISRKFKNIKFIEPVSFSDIVTTLNNYDLGIYILQPHNFNDKYALPNKFFEFIQARLATAIGPSIEMAKIVKQYGLGVCSDKFTPKSLAEAISQLTPEKIMGYKKNAHKYARELSADENIIKIKNIITKLAEE